MTHLKETKPEIIVDLNAVIFSINTADENGLIVKTINDQHNLLPWGRYNPQNHKTMEQGLRHWVNEQTDLELNYVEQLYTFGDQGRFSYGNPNRHILTTGYIASVAYDSINDVSVTWNSIYDHFPWEDFRNDRPAIIDQFIVPNLLEWSDSQETKDRIIACFGTPQDIWNDETVLERFELMYEANLVFEAIRDANENMDAVTYVRSKETKLPTGRYMQYDHRRILATALGKMRSNIKYRPVIFQLMPQVFTLFDLQKATEAILGYKLHKQNFRRYVEREKLAIPAGGMRNQPSGRPAKLYCYNKSLDGKPNSQGLRISNSGGSY